MLNFHIMTFVLFRVPCFAANVLGMRPSNAVYGGSDSWREVLEKGEKRRRELEGRIRSDEALGRKRKGAGC